MAPLSEREREVLRLVAAGLSNQETAAHLSITAGSVKKHLSNIYGKLGVSSRIQALARARELVLLFRFRSRTTINHSLLLLGSASSHSEGYAVFWNKQGYYRG